MDRGPVRSVWIQCARKLDSTGKGKDELRRSQPDAGSAVFLLPRLVGPSVSLLVESMNRYACSLIAATILRPISAVPIAG
jgi:hypothetical protein